MFEKKMKELESELSQKNVTLAELNHQISEARENEQESRNTILQLKDEVCFMDEGECGVFLFCTFKPVHFHLYRWSS